tara:strand:- start:410 stop:1285 length:876 start_codon:yes stop_codon:yes gene_type:complete
MQGRTRAEVVAEEQIKDDVLNAEWGRDQTEILHLTPQTLILPNTNFTDIAWRGAILPFAAVVSLVSAILAWRVASLNKYEGHSLARAIVETAVAATFAAAAIGALVAVTLFATIAPILFGAALAVKALFSVGSAIYFGVKASREQDQALKENYRALAKNAIVSAVVGTVVLAALAVATFVASPVALGVSVATFIAAAITGVIFTVKEEARRRVRRDDDRHLQNLADSRNSTSEMTASMRAQPGRSVTGYVDFPGNAESHVSPQAVTKESASAALVSANDGNNQREIKRNLK